MPKINIEKYQEKYFKDMTDLIVSSFKSKLCHRQKLTPDDIKNILYTTWDIKAMDNGYLHYVAKEEEKVVGVILIKCGENRKSHKKIPVFELFRRYGLLNILLLTYKLSILEIYKPEDCYIEHIAVDETLRGMGIGEMLITYAEKELKDRGFSSLSLAVAKDNPAKRLYDRIGFKDISSVSSRNKGYFTGIRHWFFMRKRLI